MSESKPHSTLTLTDHLSWQVRLLSIQFLLGMAINLIGLPSEVHGFAHTAVMIILLLHILVALLLLTNGVILVNMSRSYGPVARRLALLAAGGIITAMCGGILTLTAPMSNLWSYLMAVAFLAIFGFYGRLLSVVSRPKRLKST